MPTLTIQPITKFYTKQRKVRIFGSLLHFIGEIDFTSISLIFPSSQIAKVMESIFLYGPSLSKITCVISYLMMKFNTRMNSCLDQLLWQIRVILTSCVSMMRLLVIDSLYLDGLKLTLDQIYLIFQQRRSVMKNWWQKSSKTLKF